MNHNIKLAPLQEISLSKHPQIKESWIQKLIADASYREQLIQNGFQNAARFSASSLAQQYAAIYRLIVNRPSSIVYRKPFIK